MNNTKSIAHPLLNWDMHTLLDWKNSYQQCKKLLCDYCSQWRAERKKKNPNAGKHGGVTAYTRELVAALLRILPPGMEWIRTHRKPIYGRCIKEGLYALITTSKTIRVMMSERRDGDETDENDMAARSTVFEHLKVLERAGIIESRKALANPLDDQEEKRAMLIYLNMEAIAVFEPTSALPQHVTDEDPKNFENTACAEGADSKVRNSDYYNTLIRSNDNLKHTHENVDKASPIGDNKLEKAELVRSTESKTTVNVTVAGGGAPAVLLWKTCAKLLYPTKNFSLDIQARAIHLLDAHYEATKQYLESIRADQVAAFCETEKYKAKKDQNAKTTYLKWFISNKLYEPLRDIQTTAFSVIMEAIRIQAYACQKGNFSTYSPPIFLEMDYGIQKYIYRVREDIAREANTNILARSENVRIKSTLRGMVGSFAAIAHKDAPFAFHRLKKYLYDARVLLEEAISFTGATKKHYYQYFEKQLVQTLNAAVQK